MNFKKQNLILVTVAGLAGAGNAFAQTTVFEVPGAATPPGNYYSTSLEYGDEVILPLNPGGQWTIQSLTLPYYSNFGAADGVTVKIYANDGPIEVNGKPTPGSLLYSSGPLSVVDNGATITIPFADQPDNKVPFRFTYTVSFSGVGGNNSAGLYVPNQLATMGLSGNDYWEKSAGGDWELKKVTGGDLSNFQVSITAVPEPGIVALASLGLAGLIGWSAVRGNRKP